MKSRIYLIPASRKARAGFSLVETVMALGIVSFGFVGLLGLLSCGLVNYASARDNTVASQIAQGVFSEVRQTQFSQMEESPAATYYFDEAGQTAASARKVYTAKVSIAPKDSSPGPGQSLVMVKVEVTKISAPNAPKIFSAFVANNGT